jgi:hypothetical protein
MFSDPFGLCPPYDNDPCNLNTGDPNLDDPEARQQLENGYKAAPPDPNNAGYVKEIGGWCNGATKTCTQNVGTVDRVSLGSKPKGSTHAYHTHGNAGKPRIGGAPGDNYEAYPSDQDVVNQTSRKEPSYIIGPNTIYRTERAGKNQVKWACFNRWNNVSACPGSP